jgi:hypothetical protein
MSSESRDRISDLYHAALERTPLEETDGLRALVLELVEGPTRRDLLRW